jgi:citrate synthase
MDRLRQVYNILTGQGQTDSHLLVKDNRTNKTYHIPLTPLSESYMLRSEHLTNIRDEEGRPLRLHDPGYKQTLSASSRICYIDSLRGRLEYRGYPIAQLALRSSFLETSFLLIYGELPNKEQLLEFSDKYHYAYKAWLNVLRCMSIYKKL